MNEKYSEIINLPRHVSFKHPPMDSRSRAAQFSPFAALTGYGDAIDEAARLTCPRLELDESEKAEINRTLLTLSGKVKVTYFIPDKLKDGGSYVTEVREVKKVNPSGQYVLFTDGLKIPFDDIYGFED